MSNLGATLDARGAGEGGLRVEFIRRGDRFAHMISRLDGDSVQPLWESVEGTDADDWPPSPPLQQLSFETLSDRRRVALLVGMAGTSHWSLSVEAAVGEAALVFDVACRVKQPPTALGSRYRRTDDCQPDEQSRHCPAAIGGEPAAGGVGACSVRMTDSQLWIAPLTPSSLPPRTVRWRYRVTLGSPAGDTDR